MTDFFDCEQNFKEVFFKLLPATLLASADGPVAVADLAVGVGSAGGADLVAGELPAALWGQC
jgi:hypothetical protein